MGRLGCIALCLLLAGCFTGGKRGGDSPLAIYDFGPAPGRLVELRPEPLAMEVRAPLWFDSMGIDYRLSYLDPSRLREYARARWAGPPAQMIQLRLGSQLGLAVSGQSQAKCLLRIEINEFSQVFSTVDQSRGVLRGRAQWLGRKRDLVAEMPLDLIEAAPSPDARGGVAALTAVVDRLAQVLKSWENRLADDQRARVCFN